MGTDDAADLTAGPELAGVSALDGPLRRRLYSFVAAQGDPVSREDAAAATGIGRTLAAYHLDKLAEAGLLATAYQRAPERGGPGGGRPAKRYRLAEREFVVSVPPRAYDVLARLLVEAMEADPGGTVRTALDQVARDTGRQAADAAGGDLMAALRACAYQPRGADGGVVELRNCPFHRIAEDHRDLVCGLNLSLVTGIVDGIADGGPGRAHAELRPRPGRCCVVVNGLAESDPGGGSDDDPARS